MGLLRLIYTKRRQKRCRFQMGSYEIECVIQPECRQSSKKIFAFAFSQCKRTFMFQNRDKAKSNAIYYCEKLGRYRMPFAWTAIYLTNIVNGASSLEREAERQEREQGRADSLGKEFLFLQLILIFLIDILSAPFFHH